MWTYNSSNGLLAHDGKEVGVGYSGYMNGKNNPLLERIHNIGPIPRGNYSIIGPPFDTPDHGPYVMKLVPSLDTDTFNRAGFLIHGDSIADPGTASRGCIIMNRLIRFQIWESQDFELEVV